MSFSSPLPILLLLGVLTGVAHAGPGSVLTPATVSITRQSSASNGPAPDETIDLVRREITQANPADPGKPVHRALDPDELAPVIAALRAITNAETRHGEQEPIGGGVTRWTLRDKSGATHLLSDPVAAPANRPFVPLSRDQGLALAEAWPPAAARRPPRTTEQRIKQFLIEALFGPPGGPRDLVRSLARVDPDHKLFELFDHIQADAAVAFQLRLKPGVAISAAELGHVLDVAEPMAYRVNAEHDVWTLGDKRTGQPARTWRTAELDVRLAVRGRPSSLGPTAPIEDATVESVFLIRKTDFGK